MSCVIIMSDMLQHLGSFAYTAWEMLRSALGTSDLFICVFTVTVPLIIFVGSVGRKWFKNQPRTFGTLVTAFKQWIKPAQLALGVTTLAWLILALWAVFKTVYNDHRDLTGRLLSVVNEKNALKTTLADRDIAIAKLIKERESLSGHVQQPAASVSVLRQPPSLRDRANKLANELQAFTDERDKHMPPLVEKAPMTFEQVQAAQAPQYHYRLETYKLYDKQFSVRVVTAVAEFKAKGIDVSPIENCAASGICSPTPIPVELHSLAARLDDNDNVRR